MKILIIDNGTVRISELQELLKEHTCKNVKLGCIDSSTIDEFDVVILSGSSKFSVLRNESLYKNEINLIKNSTKPIIGICLGFELIAHAFGAKLTEIDKKIHGIVEVSVVEQVELNELFLQLPNFSVFEGHRWIVEKSPENFITLAVSKYGVEAFKHKNRELYGFQFHPSVFPEKTCGDEIFGNLLAAIEKSL